MDILKQLLEESLKEIRELDEAMSRGGSCYNGTCKECEHADATEGVLDKIKKEVELPPTPFCFVVKETGIPYMVFEMNDKYIIAGLISGFCAEWEKDIAQVIFNSGDWELVTAQIFIKD